MVDQSSRDIEHFNSRATTYESARSQSYFFGPLQNRVLKLTSNLKPSVVLDVGCGTGRLLRRAKLQWPDAKLIGVDAAEKMIEQASNLFQDAEFHVAMAESLPLSDSSVDVAFSTFSFHHWANQTKGVSEIARVLRPEGQFLLADIVIPKWMSHFVRHFRYNSPAQVHSMFSLAGLAVQLQQQPWRWSKVLLLTLGRKEQAKAA
jgi:ubiquinone/menaquinone biosynthesis C-methylase UbiE